MKDVANAAQVSQATVSYVINQSAAISPQVRKKVTDAIEKLGYIQNASAKSLKTRRTNTIGMIIPSIDSGYYSQMIRETEFFLKGNGYVMFLCSTDYDPELERKYIKALIEQNVSGIIVGYGLVDPSVYRDVRYHEKNIIVMDDNVSGGLSAGGESAIPSVEVNNIEGGKIAASHLLDISEKKICFASEPLFNRSLQNRFEGFRIGIKERGYSGDKWCSIIEQKQYNKAEMGYNIGAKILLNRDIDAVFATSDNLAYGIVQILLEYRKRIPKDIAIMGYDNIPLAQYMTPKLSTISQPIREVAQNAVAELIGVIENKAFDFIREPFNPTLIIRNSTIKI